MAQSVEEPECGAGCKELVCDAGCQEHDCCIGCGGARMCAFEILIITSVRVLEDVSASIRLVAEKSCRVI